MPSESDKWGWKHVSVFGGFDKGSGTKRWKCNHCNLRYNGSYSRVRAHLLGFTGVGVKSCPAIDRSLREAFQILEEERLVRKKKRTSGNRKPKKFIRTSQPSVTCVSKAITKEDLDDIVARFFYADGLNLKAIDSPYFHELVRAIAAFGPGYEPPPVEKLSDSFLNKEKARIEKAMALVRESWPHSGCTIMYVNSFDGTLSSCCINIFVSSPRGLLFLKAIEVKDSVELENLLASVLSDAIIEIGPKNVIQIISHLGPKTESFESLMTSKFPHIFWSPCTLHSIRLLMDDIAELDWIKPIVLRAKGIEQCVLNYHQHSSSISSLTQDLKEIFDPLAAKFAPAFCVVQRIFKLKQELQVAVVSEEWKQWRLNISEDIICIEDVILGDDFWSRAYLILQLWDPFLTLLPALSIDKSIMGDVYYWRVQALGLVRSKGIDDIVLNQLEMLIEGRWDMLFSPLHAAGYILNPRYFGKGQTKDKTAMRGWKATLERYESDGTARRVLREQLSSYWRLEGSLGEDDAIDCRDKMDPVTWWENFGFESPQLQTLAIKILSQVSSVSMCQESGQDHCFSCQKTTGRLKMGRGEDLAFVRNNLKLHRQRIGNSSPLSGQRNVTLNSLSGVRI